MYKEIPIFIGNRYFKIFMYEYLVLYNYTNIKLKLNKDDR